MKLYVTNATIAAVKIDPRFNGITDCLYRVAAKAFIIQNNKVLLVKELLDEGWGFPGGGVDYGEHPAEALRREVSEELAIKQECIEVIDSVEYITCGAVVSGVPRVNLFYCVILKNTSISASDHVQESGWFSYGELLDLNLSTTTGNLNNMLKAVSIQFTKVKEGTV